MSHTPEMPLHIAMIHDEFWNGSQHTSSPASLYQRTRHKLAARTTRLDRHTQELGQLKKSSSIQITPIPYGQPVPILSQEQPGLMKLIIDDKVRGKYLPYVYPQHSSMCSPREFEHQAAEMEANPLYVGPPTAIGILNRTVMRSVVYARGFGKLGWAHGGAQGDVLERVAAGNKYSSQAIMLLGNLIVGRTETIDYGFFSTNTRVTFASHLAA